MEHIHSSIYEVLKNAFCEIWFFFLCIHMVYELVCITLMKKEEEEEVIDHVGGFCSISFCVYSLILIACLLC